MNEVLIGNALIEKAINRFIRKPGADIVFFDRIAGNSELHFSIAKRGSVRPKAYSRTEQVGLHGKIYDIFLPEKIKIARAKIDL